MVSSLLVREMGLEPTRRNHTHLKRACLPFQHSRKCLNIITAHAIFVNNFFRFWGKCAADFLFLLSKLLSPYIPQNQ